MTKPERSVEDLEEAPTPRSSRLWWWIGGIALVAVAVVATLTLLDSDSGGATTDTTAALSFEEVVRTDLIQMDSFDGTLGTEAGDPVASPIAGTVTSTAEVGATTEQGDVLLTVNNEPVVLLYGDLPAYRALQATDDAMALTGAKPGVVTEVVAAGDTIAQGDVLYRVNDEPVVVMYGDSPAYRTLRDLSDNMTGADVLQLEQALVALGYDPNLEASVDEEFTDYTETMVERWQEALGVEETGRVDYGDVIFIPAASEVLAVNVAVGDTVNAGFSILTISTGDPLQGDDVLQLEEALVALGYEGPVVDGIWDPGTSDAVLAWQAATGLEEDGVVDLGEVVFLPSQVRVTDVVASVGSSVSPGAPVLGISSSDQFVTFDLPAADQGLVAVGQEVIIEMPDGSDTAGTVIEIDSVATGGQGNATFGVKIVLDDPSVAVGLDEAPVDVEVISDSVLDVMAIPVSALVALAEGGYAVEVQTATATQLIAVEPGFYADGLVEIESAGLSVGDMVVVP
jgi:peptidoglycan hydrolase-like protein with peptidoglycan-binding domain